MKSPTLKAALLLLVFHSLDAFASVVCSQKEIPAYTGPVAMDDVAFVQNAPLPIPVLSNDIPASSGGALALSGLMPCSQQVCTTITTANGGQATIQGSNILYTPPATPVADTFEYTIHDTVENGSDTARVDIFASGGVAITYTCNNGNCSFTAHPADTNGIRRFLWTWGDSTPGQPVELPDRVSHTYSASGTYLVTVRVEYWDGHSATGQVEAAVNISQNVHWNLVIDGLMVTIRDWQLNSLPLGGNILVNWSANADDCYHFCGPLHAGSSWLWIGSVQGCGYTACNGTGQYKRPGTYTGTVRFTHPTDPNGPPTDYSFFVTVANRAPNPFFYFTRPDPNVRRIEFDSEPNDDGPYPLGPFEWDFGDGTTYVDPDGTADPAHTYANAGGYDVTLKVTDADGVSGITSIWVPVANTPPAPAMTVNCRLLDCTFTADPSVDDGNAFSAYLWNFGDGTTAQTAQAVKQYTTPGCRDVTLRLTDTDGASSTIHQIVPVGPALSGGAARVVADAHVQSFRWGQKWETTNGNLNGILEPGETVVVEPTWQAAATSDAVSVFADSWTTTDYGYANPEFRDYVSSYDLSTGTSDCWSKGRCYAVKLAGSSAARNQAIVHNDVAFQEKYLSSGLPTPGSPIAIHVGASFTDVPASYWAYPFIESALHFGIAGGCAGLNYCPQTQLTRGQIASWLLKAKNGRTWEPPACVEPGPFNDVPCTHPEARWIQQLEADGITSGTGGGNYTPDAILTRAELTVFVLRAKHGAAYAPPTCSIDFGDVQCPGHWAANWISDAKLRGISVGCSAYEYCPGDAVDRAQAAALIVRGFDLRLDKTACPTAVPAYDAVQGHVIKLPIQSLTFSPSPVLMGTQATGTITVAWPTGAAVNIPLTSDHAALTVPANVLVPSGQSTATFTVTGNAVAVRTPVNVSATYFNHTKTTRLDVCTPKPLISQQPQSKIINAGQSATLTVTASVGGTLTYQWYQGTAPSTANPIGTNSPSLTVTPTATTSYWVRVTNECDSTNSETAIVTVCYPPTITVQPLKDWVAPGTSTTLMVTATGSAPMSYQWYEGVTGNTSTPVGTDSNTFTTPALLSDKSYWVRVTSRCNGVQTTDSVTAPVVLINQITRRQTATRVENSQQGITTNWARPTRAGTLLVAVISASRKFQPVADFATPPGWQHAETSDRTGLKTSIYYYPNNPGSRTAETFTTGGFWNELILTLNEYVGVQTAGALDKTAVSGGDAVPADGIINTGFTPTTSQANEVAVTGLSVYAVTEFSNADNLFEEVSDSTISSWLSAAVHERVVNVASGWGHTASVPGITKQWVGAVATFKQAELLPGGCTAAPTITAHPTSRAINTGDSTTLSVTASGGGTLSYQWYQGSAPSKLNPVGTNSNTLTVTPAFSANYWVEVRNACGPAQSFTATVTVCTPPSVATQPASQTIGSGATATLSVIPGGSGGFNYQWYEGTSGTTTTPVGGNSNTFTTPALNFTKSYWVRITSTCSGGSVNSNTATVTVTLVSEITRRQIASSMANSQTSITANWTQPTQAGSLLVAVISASSHLGPIAVWSAPPGWLHAYEYEYSSIKTAVYYYPNNPGGRTSETFTDGGWYRDQILQLAEYTGIATTSPLDKTAFRGGDTPPSPPIVETGYTPQTSQPNELIITALTTYGATTFSAPDNQFVETHDHTNGWHLSTAVHQRVVNTMSTYGHAATIDSPDAVPWLGVVATFKAATIDCSAAPSITAQPTSRTINAGQSTTLTVTASGEGVLTYQWYQGTAPSTTTPVGTNSNSLTVTPAATTSYWVKVSNACGPVSSNTATVTVCNPLGIAVQPASQTINSGATATLTMTPSGSGVYSYQWYEGTSGTTTTPVGTNTNTFTTPALTATKSYWVRLSSSCNGASVNSNTATVCITPGIATQPASQTINSGATATLTVTANGTGPFNYQWYEGASGTTTTPVGTNNSSFTTPALTTSKSYWVKVTSTCTGTVSVNSNTAMICISPSIATQPASQTIGTGATATLTVTPGGTGPFSYQWYEGTSGTTTTPVGTNSSSFTTPALTATKSYWVRVTSTCNGANSVNSNTATVTVTTCSALGIAAQPQSTTINAGATATLTVTPSGSGPFSYQWYEGTSGTTTTPVGTNGSSFTTPALTATKSYWVRVTSTCSGSVSVNSNTAVVTVCNPLGIAVQPASQTINSGATATLTVTPSGSGVYSYQWYEGPSGTTTTPVGTNTNTFTTPALTATKSYWVRVTTSCNGASVNSNTATITVTPAQISRRQTAYALANSQTSITANWTQATQAGNLLVAIISGNKDPNGEVYWTPPAGWLHALTNEWKSVKTSIYYIPNNAGGRTSETFTVAAGYHDQTLHLLEYAGAMTASNPLDKLGFNGNDTHDGMVDTGFTANTAQPREVVITALTAYAPTEFSSPSTEFVEIFDHSIGNSLTTAVHERITYFAASWGHYVSVGIPCEWIGLVVTFRAANTSASILSPPAALYAGREPSPPDKRESPAISMERK